MPKQPTSHDYGQTEFSGESVHVSATVLTGKPATIVPATEEPSEEFTLDAFEGALDKSSEPVKGKYSDLLPSSDEFIRDKRREVELEDRPS
jgi:hypothetical protein